MDEIPAWAMAKARGNYMADDNGFTDNEWIREVARALAAERKAGVDGHEILKTEISNKARELAQYYPEESDGRNTLILFADWVERK